MSYCFAVMLICVTCSRIRSNSSSNDNSQAPILRTSVNSTHHALVVSGRSPAQNKIVFSYSTNTVQSLGTLPNWMSVSSLCSRMVTGALLTIVGICNDLPSYSILSIGHTTHAVPAPNNSWSRFSSSDFTMSFMKIRRSTTLNSPHCLERSSKLWRVTPGKIKPVDNGGVASSFSPASFVQNAKKFIVPTSVTSWSGPYSHRTCNNHK